MFMFYKCGHNFALLLSMLRPKNWQAIRAFPARDRPDQHLLYPHRRGWPPDICGEDI